MLLLFQTGLNLDGLEVGADCPEVVDFGVVGGAVAYQLVGLVDGEELPPVAAVGAVGEAALLLHQGEAVLEAVGVYDLYVFAV